MSNVQILALVTLALIIVQTKADKIECDDLIPQMSSCHGFLLSQSATPSQECCVILQDLSRDVVTSQPNRQAMCQCYKAATLTFPIDIQKAQRLPQLCNFTSTMPIDPNVDCSKV
uniref:Non-specific lipid-transfer protein-like n=1 Tax=Nicotiana tabacum TaxID=4097 RepID=A0A1S4C1T6_TOBAC|nr:PREDICTED: non-specific lipid-transfer protein-like [Nicotiana tabacum]